MTNGAVDIVSLAAGVVLTIFSGVIVYAITKVWMFKTKIYWPKESDQKSDIIYSDGLERATAAYLNTIILVKGSEPAREVKIHFTGSIDSVEMYPKIPFKRDSERNFIEIGSLNSGLYNIKTKYIGTSWDMPRMTGVEAMNAVCVEREVQGEQFRKPEIFPTVVFATSIVMFVIAILISVVFP